MNCSPGNYYIIFSSFFSLTDLLLISKRKISSLDFLNALLFCFYNSILSFLFCCQHHWTWGLIAKWGWNHLLERKHDSQWSSQPLCSLPPVPAWLTVYAWEKVKTIRKKVSMYLPLILILWVRAVFFFVSYSIPFSVYESPPKSFGKLPLRWLEYFMVLFPSWLSMSGS